MKKVVINACYGGFGLSREAADKFCSIKGIDPGEWNKSFKFYSNFHSRDIPRDDPVLVEIVESMGEAASGECAELKIVEIPEGLDWQIEEYDGNEWVSEKHRTWS